ncbi:MAG: FMN-binding protein [Anaerovoracaceae bacterium]
MKKTIKVILIIIVLLGISVCGFRMIMDHQISETYDRLDAVAAIDLSVVEDGVYEGTEETALVKVTVKVEVKDHKMIDIQLIRHENGKGKPAEDMIPEMLRENTSEVDCVSGATMSSKTIRAAVRNALAKGIVENA